MDIPDLLKEIQRECGSRKDRGKVADYIPALAKVDIGKFGMTVCLVDGSVHSIGDSNTAFSIQSVSKVFSLALALGKLGDRLWHRVGREPSGYAFNSMIQLESENGRPRNPFINAGAIVVTDSILTGSTPAETLASILRFVRITADDEDIHINKVIAKSEACVGHRNFALANFMRAFGNLNHPAELTLGTYFHHCAIDMTCVQLAKAGRFLVGAENIPAFITTDRIRRINALMLMCGHYDGSGDFAYRVGLPGKSGVGGGILVIAPNKASIAVWSPGLDEYGNSKLGTTALEHFARETGWSVFG